MTEKLIMLVEDNPVDIELTRRAFRKSGVANRIVVAKDGAEALDYLFCEGEYIGRNIDESPSVVLLDLKLPKVDGFEVLRRLRADPRTRLLPVVILTSSREQKDLIDGYSLGANSYIVKPVDYDEFTEALEQLELYWLSLNETPTGS